MNRKTRKATLHEEIRDILISEGNRWMSTGELASLVNRRGRYRKRDGSPVSRFQIHGRTRNYSDLFQRSGSLVRLKPEQAILTSMSHPRTTHSVPELRRQGFKGFLSVSDLRVDGSTEIPAVPGVYLFLRTRASCPEFLAKGSGGRFKGKDPNVTLARLQSEWVDGALIVYVGQTGSGSKGTLRRRIELMLRFGHGAPVGHWGGRLIWQLKDSDQLRVCWKPITQNDPRKIESALIRSFKSMHGAKRPFANLRD